VGADPVVPGPVVRFDIDLPQDVNFTGTGRHTLAISPGGTHVVFTANEQIYMRAMDALVAVPLSGTERARSPFFSPDGQWVGFWSGDEIRKVPISGGAPVKLADALNLSGASWGDDDTIVYGQGAAGIWKVSGEGGDAEVLVEVEPDQRAQGPQFLPGGEWLLYAVRRSGNSFDDAEIVVRSLTGSGETKVLIRGGRDARYVPTGHLVYAFSDVVFARPFDPSRMEFTGGAVSVLQEIAGASGASGASQFQFSSLGSLVYLSGNAAVSRSLVWVDGNGDESLIDTFADMVLARPRLSPDNTHIAMEVVSDGERDIRVYDLERGGTTQLSHEGGDYDPLWTPDGDRIVFSSNRGEFESLFWRRSNGVGEEEALPQRGIHENAYSWSSDGTELAVYTRPGTAETPRDVWVLSRDDNWSPKPIATGEFNERSPAFSPDGAWLAYVSDESGRDEVYVLSYPDLNDKFVISTNGGREPAWSADGSELFYRVDDDFMAVTLTTEPSFSAGAPRLLFTGPYARDTSTSSGSRTYDVARDGRFVIVRLDRPENDDSFGIHVVLNWFEELKQRVPTGR